MIFWVVITVWVSVPAIIWFLVRSRVPAWLSVPLYSAIIAIAFYALIVVSAVYFERKVEADYVEFNLAHDGIELTEKQRKERERLFGKIISDTGRTFAPITGAIFSVVYFFLIWLAIHVVKRFLSGTRFSIDQTDE